MLRPNALLQELRNVCQQRRHDRTKQASERVPTPAPPKDIMAHEHERVQDVGHLGRRLLGLRMQGPSARQVI